MPNGNAPPFGRDINMGQEQTTMRSDDTLPEPTDDDLQHKPPKETGDPLAEPGAGLDIMQEKPVNATGDDANDDLADVKGDGNLGLTDETTPAE